MLNLGDFKGAIINTFKELKETMLKELKEIMMTVPQEIGNLKRKRGTIKNSRS